MPKKLGLSEATRLLLVGAPSDYNEILGPFPFVLQTSKTVRAETNMVHLFATEKRALELHLKKLRASLHSNAVVWVSWPKKASKVPTDVTEDTIREVALPLGYVDVKVCAVSEVWSGLKLVVRVALR